MKKVGITVYLTPETIERVRLIKEAQMRSSMNNTLEVIIASGLARLDQHDAVQRGVTQVDTEALRSMGA